MWTTTTTSAREEGFRVNIVIPGLGLRRAARQRGGAGEFNVTAKTPNTNTGLVRARRATIHSFFTLIASERCVKINSAPVRNLGEFRSVSVRS